MLVVSRAKQQTRRLRTQLTPGLQTKHAAELLALLVNDLYGELPSVHSPRSLISLQPDSCSRG